MVNSRGVAGDEGLATNGADEGRPHKLCSESWIFVEGS